MAEPGEFDVEEAFDDAVRRMVESVDRRLRDVFHIPRLWSIPFPIRCARCCRPVERVEYVEDGLGGATVTVRCHGDSESRHVDASEVDQIVEAVRDGRHVSGVAFDDDPGLGTPGPAGALPALAGRRHG